MQEYTGRIGMDKAISDKLRASIKKHEGFRKLPYVDTTGHTSIGFGRNLSANGISEAEADYMLSDDILIATSELYRFVPWAQTLDDVRKAVLIEMTFNMGIEKVLQFRHMLDNLKTGNFAQAAAEMLDSLWAKQVHARANDLAFSMEFGSL